MLRETLVEVQHLLELCLKLSDFPPFRQSFQFSLLKETVLLHLLLSCLYADINRPSKDKEIQVKTDSKKKKKEPETHPPPQQMPFHITITFQAQR